MTEGKEKGSRLTLIEATTYMKEALLRYAAPS